MRGVFSSIYPQIEIYKWKFINNVTTSTVFGTSIRADVLVQQHRQFQRGFLKLLLITNITIVEKIFFNLRLRLRLLATKRIAKFNRLEKLLIRRYKQT